MDLSYKYLYVNTYPDITTDARKMERNHRVNGKKLWREAKESGVSTGKQEK